MKHFVGFSLFSSNFLFQFILDLIALLKERFAIFNFHTQGTYLYLTEDITHPGKRALKTMDIHQRLLSVNISVDRKEVLEYTVSTLITYN